MDDFDPACGLEGEVLLQEVAERLDSGLGAAHHPEGGGEIPEPADQVHQPGGEGGEGRGR